MLGTKAQDYYFNDLPWQNTRQGRKWSGVLPESDKESFVLIHFKPYISQNTGVREHFDTFVYLNGVPCSTKSADYSSANLVLDVMCSFVASPNVNYQLEFVFHADYVGGYVFNIDSGNPIVTIVRI